MKQLGNELHRIVAPVDPRVAAGRLLEDRREPTFALDQAKVGYINELRATLGKPTFALTDFFTRFSRRLHYFSTNFGARLKQANCGIERCRTQMHVTLRRGQVLVPETEVAVQGHLRRGLPRLGWFRRCQS